MSLQVGDIVRVRESAEEKCNYTLGCGWNSRMQPTLGCIGIVERESMATGCYRVNFPSLSDDWTYPESALEKVGDSVTTSHEGSFITASTFASSPWFDIEAEEEEEVILKTKKTFMSIIKNLTKSKEQKALESFGLLNSDNTLNEEGRREFVTFLFQGDAKTAFEAEIVKAYEDKCKKDCK